MNHKVNLVELLGNESVIRIFEFFDRNPSQGFYVEQLKRKLEMSKVTVIKWVGFLREWGLLGEEVKGRMKIYTLNLEHPVVRQLRVLFVIVRVYPALMGLEDSEVYLFGSASRGEHTEESDVDILVLSEESSDNVIGKIRVPEARVMIMSRLEYSELARSDPALYERIERDRIRVF